MLLRFLVLSFLDLHRSIAFAVANGVPEQKNYPYIGNQAACQAVQPVPNLLKNITNINVFGNETQLMQLLVRNGPIVICMWSDDAFMAYKSGIYEQVATPESCTMVNHAMVLVGKKS